VTALIVLVALPAMIDTWITISRREKQQIQRGCSTNLAQAVFEQIHYRIYNGTEDGDCRGGLRLNDSFETRKVAYEQVPPSYLKIFFQQKERNVPLVRSGFFNGLNGSPDLNLEGNASRELADALKSYTCQVQVWAYLGDSAEGSADETLKTKLKTNPKVDMARLAVMIAWKDANGKTQKRTFVTRLCRPIVEADALASVTGL
jgi:hypothetical protein